VPFAFGQKWKYQQLGEWPPQQLFPLIRRAESKYSDDEIKSAVEKLPPIDASDRNRLLSF
jgi:hypothetical protein